MSYTIHTIKHFRYRVGVTNCWVEHLPIHNKCTGLQAHFSPWIQHVVFWLRHGSFCYKPLGVLKKWIRHPCKMKRIPGILMVCLEYSKWQIPARNHLDLRCLEKQQNLINENIILTTPFVNALSDLNRPR